VVALIGTTRVGICAGIYYQGLAVSEELEAQAIGMAVPRSTRQPYRTGINHKMKIRVLLTGAHNEVTCVWKRVRNWSFWLRRCSVEPVLGVFAEEPERLFAWLT
jgi:hypothetical protein